MGKAIRKNQYSMELGKKIRQKLQIGLVFNVLLQGAYPK